MKTKKDKDINAAAVLSAVYIIGMVAIVEATDRTPVSFWLCIVWLLAVIIYALIHDYIENLRASVHDRIKAVCRAEMRFLEERKRFYEDIERIKHNDVQV